MPQQCAVLTYVYDCKLLCVDLCTPVDMYGLRITLAYEYVRI